VSRSGFGARGNNRRGERIRPAGDSRVRAQCEPVLRSVASAGSVTVITFDTRAPFVGEGAKPGTHPGTWAFISAPVDPPGPAP